MTPAQVAPAATVVLLRPDDAGDGYSVLLVRRHRGSAFLPDAWVFPGGRVEPEDAALPAHRLRGGVWAHRLGDDGVGFLVGAARETFEEAGVWLGERPPSDLDRREVASGRRKLDAAMEASGGVLDLDRFVPWSRWVTPEGERRRFDTVFLLTVAKGAVAAHDGHETVASQWVRPADVAQLPLSELVVAPPTWWMLRELAERPTLAQLLADAPSRDLRPILPVLDAMEGGPGILLPGHLRHPEPARPGLPTKIVLMHGAWVGDR